MITINDIEIFITTHNRADLISESIDSLLNQTIKPEKITVLDNESTDDTENIIKKYSDKGVEYLKTFGFLGNYNKAKEIASKKYCMLFHDDDILHPKYLEMAIKILNKYTNISLITTRYKEFEDRNVPDFAKKINPTYFLFKKQKDFAAHMYFIEHISYAPAIYRTEDFKKTPLEYEKYNKFNDWPLMVKMSAYGKTILFDDKNIMLCRRHSGQDTWTYTNVPNLEQIVNWDKLFFDAMQLKNSKFSILQKMFNRKSWCFMKGKYTAFIPPEEKEKHTENELYIIAQKNNLFPDQSQKKASFYISKTIKILNYIIKNIKCKHVR